MTDSTSVRRAREDDGEALRAIDLSTWSSRVSPAPVPAATRPFFDERTTPDDVLVAEVEGRPAGYVAVHQSIPVPSHEHVLEIGGLAVDPAAQGRGVGRALVEAAIEEARRRGARKLTLRVLAHNTPARRLYERCGFHVEGVLTGEFVLDGVDVDDVLMARPLSGPRPRVSAADSQETDDS